MLLLPGGMQNCTLRWTSSFSFAASANVNPRRNAWLTSAVNSSHCFCTATLLTMRCPHLEVVPAKVDKDEACKSLKPRTTKRAWMMRLPFTIYHFSTQRASMTFDANRRSMRRNAPNVCHRVISSSMACSASLAWRWASSRVRILYSRSTTVAV